VEKQNISFALENFFKSFHPIKTPPIFLEHLQINPLTQKEFKNLKSNQVRFIFLNLDIFFQVILGLYNSTIKPIWNSWKPNKSILIIKNNSIPFFFHFLTKIILNFCTKSDFLNLKEPKLYYF